MSHSPPPPTPWLVGNMDDGTKFWYQSHDPSNILFSEPVPSPPAEIALPVGVEFCLLHHASGKSNLSRPHPFFNAKTAYTHVITLQAKR